MARYDETYERAVAKLLTEHVEHGVPDDTDLWATVEQRLAQRNSAAPAVHAANKQSLWQNLTNRLFSLNSSTNTKKRPVVGFAMGTLGLALVALLTVISISRFAQIGNGGTTTNQTTSPTGVTTNNSTILSDVLFSIPVDQANIHWHADCRLTTDCFWTGTTGIGVASDGSFYIGDADKRALHYSSTGSLLDAQAHLPSTVPLFFTMRGDRSWWYYSLASITDMPRLPTGFWGPSNFTWVTTFPNQNPPTVVSGTQSISIVAGIISLQIGGDGQLIVETTALDDHDVPTYNKSYLIQVIGADGKPDLKLLPGYPAGGKYYTTEVAPGSKSGYVTDGDIRVEITSTLYIRRLDVRSVRPDGSFYVISEERVTPAPNSNGGDTVSSTSDANYIYHYSASGKLIERARIPGIFVPHVDVARRLTQDANGTFYWLQPIYPAQGGDPTSVEIHRINFFPAGQPLPGEEPTPLPTVTPVTVAYSDDNIYLFSLQAEDLANRDRYDSSIGLSDDGSFWFPRGDNSLVHYGPNGSRLGTLGIDSKIGRINDIEVNGSNLWLLAGDSVYTLGMDGTTQAQYVWWPPIPATTAINPSLEIVDKLILRANGDGAMLLEWDPLKYSKIVHRNYDNSFSWPPATEYYSAGGKVYLRGASANQILAGNAIVTVEVPGSIADMHLLKVMPDGSFYIAAMTEETDIRPYYESVYAYGRFQYVMHYGADGKLIERARASSAAYYTWAKEMAVGPDGNVYALEYSTQPSMVGPEQQLTVVRLKFYPASVSLPPAPTSIPTPVLPTPVPTVEGKQIPTAVPTGAIEITPTQPSSIATPTPFVTPTRPVAVLRDGVTVTLIREEQSSITGVHTENCGAEMTWVLQFENTGSEPFVIDIDKSSLKMTDSTGKSYPLSQACQPYSGSFGEPATIGKGEVHKGYITFNAENIPSEASYFELDLRVSGIQAAIRYSLPVPSPTAVAQATPTRIPSSPPVALSREGDGFRVDVYTGTVDFSYINSPWIAPSKLVLRWNPMQGDDNHSPVRYLLDVNTATMREFLSGRGDIEATANPNGKRVALVEYTMDTQVDIQLYDLETGHNEMVWYPDPSFGQWAPRGLFDPFGNGQPPARATVEWLNDDTFVLTVRQERNNAVNQPIGDDGGALFLVNIPNKQVSKLSTYGKVLAITHAGDMLLREGLLDGNVRLLAPPYKTAAQAFAATGTWTVGWSFSPDYSKVAWLEMTPPPGDWSNSLPNSCCSSDPPPIPKDIALFDRITGHVTRTDISNFAWSSPDETWRSSYILRWSNDGSAIFYSTHPAPDRTTLYRLSLDGQSTALLYMDKRIGLNVVAQDSNGSVYYTIIGQYCQDCVELAHRRSDGSSEVILPNNVPTHWLIDNNGRLEHIKDGGIAITDLTTGQSRQAIFPGEQITGGEIGWSTLGNLVPVSPDGQWAAYGGSQSDAIPIGPNGLPADRGRVVHIARVK